ncbi:MAG TPA: MarR family transcriptional regulator [Bacteroidia bacterium]|jgi:DNA-binding MarR family transcriptional regulator|nr:MarR family transcriptional regulator [Bacteroidia bacterium]
MGKQYTETIDSKLKTAWQIVSRMYNTEASKYNATISTAHFLLNIDSHEGSYASDIAPRLGTESTSLSRIIDSLEKEKLIVRRSDKEDKRRIKILLTQKGKQKKELAKTYVRDFNQLVAQRIGKNRVEEFFKTVNEIIEVAEEKNKLQKR